MYVVIDYMVHARAFKPRAWRELHELSFFKIMSFLEVGPVIFGGNDKIIRYLRSKHLLARSKTCTRQVYIILTLLKLYMNMSTSLGRFPPVI